MKIANQRIGRQLFLLLFLLLLAAFALCSQTQGRQEKKKKKAAQAAVLGIGPQFDQWLFTQDRAASAARRRLESTLKLQIAEIDRACQLTDAQKKNLQLAGTGDIVRFFDRCEDAREKFEAIKDQQQRAQQTWQLIEPLQRTLENGLFAGDSLFYKSLHRIVTGDQWTRYQAVANEEREFRRRAMIELVVASLEEEMPLSDKQRQRLITLLLSRVKLPRKPGSYAYYAIMLQFAKTPEEELKPLFDSMQWKVVVRNRSQFKGLEQFLKQNNIWPEKEDAE
jgi:hypothetical protein